MQKSFMYCIQFTFEMQLSIVLRSLHVGLGFCLSVPSLPFKIKNGIRFYKILAAGARMYLSASQQMAFRVVHHIPQI